MAKKKKVTAEEEKIDLRILKTKTRLTQALLDLMQEKSFQEIKISDLCEKAKISRATFYNNFETTKDVLCYYFDCRGQSLIEMIRNEFDGENLSFPQAYKSLIHHILTLIYQDKSHILTTLKQNQSSQVYSILREFLNKSTCAVLQKYGGKIDSNIPIEMAASYLSGAFIGLISYLIPNNEKYTIEQMEDYIFRLTIPMYYDSIPKKELLVK